ncbi:hypothetical protein EIP91_006043 [Steccherinum ochraceum]|uniref:Uncharacterized protein n=1 Tax=Steccherinum ochraceum TaxID=92696 RepID=A0A4R0R8W0_9APHY|nr:hypothetical protein EIP91_006043 [Steccherinum ochraceum]
MRLRNISTSTGTSSAHHPSTYSYIIPVDRLGSNNGVIGSLRVKFRLWRISACVKAGGVVPAQFYWDLVEAQRLWQYPLDITQRAWVLLAELLCRPSPHPQAVVEALVGFPKETILSFIRSAAHESRALGNPITPIISLVATVQTAHPGFLNDILTIRELCTLIVPHRFRTQLPSEHPLAVIANALAGNKQELLPPDGSNRNPSCTETSRGSLSSWDSTSFLDAFITFLMDGDVNQLQAIASSIASSIKVYAEEYPSWEATMTILRRVPSVDPHGEHPLTPFIHLSIHVAYHSKAAATYLIDEGILQSLGRLWLHDFPDPQGPSNRFGPRLRIRDAIRMQMRAGCILLLGALARHHAGARELADHLLQLDVPVPEHHQVPEVSRDMSMLSPFARKEGFHYAAIHVAALETTPQALDVIPSLTLFMMEMCVANRVPLASRSHSFGDAFASLMTLVSRTDTDAYCSAVKDAAVRIMLACVSTPESYWTPFLHTLKIWPENGSHVAYYYIIHEFLRATRDPTTITADNQHFLRWLHQKAVSRNVKPAHPVDRFILFIEQLVRDPNLSKVLDTIGVAQLVRALVERKYDFLLPDEEPLSAEALKERGQVCARVMSTIAVEVVDKPQNDLGYQYADSSEWSPPPVNWDW